VRPSGFTGTALFVLEGRYPCTAPCAASANSPTSRFAAVASLEFLARAARAKLISPGSLARPFGSGCRKFGQAHSPLFQSIGLKKSKFFIGCFIMSALLVGPIIAIHQNEVFRIGGCIFWRVNGYADDLPQVWKLQLRRAACDLKHDASHNDWTKRRLTGQQAAVSGLLAVRGLEVRQSVGRGKAG
jgi:hypothetical protein